MTNIIETINKTDSFFSNKRRTCSYCSIAFQIAEYMWILYFSQDIGIHYHHFGKRLKQNLVPVSVYTSIYTEVQNVIHIHWTAMLADIWIQISCISECKLSNQQQRQIKCSVLLPWENKFNHSKRRHLPTIRDSKSRSCSCAWFLLHKYHSIWSALSFVKVQKTDLKR
jgi:hypothetical protein